MTEIVMNASKQKFCPLCGDKWVIYEEEEKKGRAFFVCKRCMISIWIRDPLLGKWDTLPKVNCPNCNTDMRMFARAADSFMAMKCPNKKCRCDIRTDDPEYTGRGKPFGAEVKTLTDEEKQR